MAILDKKKSGHSCFLRITLFFLFSCLISILSVEPAIAVNSSAYQAEVPVASYSATDWQKATIPALNQVLVKLSGDNRITQKENIRKAIINPSVFVQSYHYIEHTNPKSLAVQIQFSPKAVDKLIQKAGDSTITLPASASSEQVEKRVSDEKNMALQQHIQASEPSASPVFQSVNLVVSGMLQLQDYTAMVDYLRHIVGVIDVNSQQTKGDRVLLVLKISIPQSTFVQILDHDGKLVKAPIQNTNNPAIAALLSYRWLSDHPAESLANTVNHTDKVSVSAPPAVQPVDSAPQDPEIRSPQSVSVKSSGDQLLVPGDATKAPIVEGMPTTPNIANPADAADNAPVSQAQTFGVSNADSFLSDDSVPP